MTDIYVNFFFFFGKPFGKCFPYHPVVLPQLHFLEPHPPLRLEIENRGASRFQSSQIHNVLRIRFEREAKRVQTNLVCSHDLTQCCNRRRKECDTTTDILIIVVIVIIPFFTSLPDFNIIITIIIIIIIKFLKIPCPI